MLVQFLPTFSKNLLAYRIVFLLLFSSVIHHHLVQKYRSSNPSISIFSLKNGNKTVDLKLLQFTTTSNWFVLTNQVQFLLLFLNMFNFDFSLVFQVVKCFFNHSTSHENIMCRQQLLKRNFQITCHTVLGCQMAYFSVFDRFRKISYINDLVRVCIKRTPPVHIRALVQPCQFQARIMDEGGGRR